MPSTLPPLEILEKCCDPALLVSGTGDILWQNPAATKLWRLSERSIVNISALFEKTSTRRLLETDYASSFEVIPLDSATGDTAFACSVLNVGSGGPGTTVFFVLLQTFVPESTRVAEHEEFLAMVAHDLKNPLGAIFGYADALLDTSLSEGLNEKQREVIQRIRNTSFRTLELVRNFQHLAQIKSSKIVPTTRVTDLNLSIQAVVDSTWRPSSAGSKLIINFSPEPLLVRIDKIQLERVIANLVNNALKFTPSGGTIVVRSMMKDGLPGFEVKNSGSFIPPQEIGLIFERYQRASTGKNLPGSGLGLFIVKSILNSVGGTVTATSSIQDGTSFIVTLPK